MTEEHSSFIKTPKQLAIVVILAFAVPIALVVLLSQLVTGVSPRGQSEPDVQRRILPVGQVTVAEANAQSGNQTGEQVYEAVCKTCHEAGLAGAPKFGDKSAWAPRIKSGVDALFTSAIKGKNAMPPKGGNANLADVEVERAVVYMANKAGANFKESSAPTQPATAAASAAQAPAAAAPAPAAQTKAQAAAPAAASKTSAPAAAPGGQLDMASGAAMMQKDGCAPCHAVDKKLVGPAYQDVAAKYKGDKDAAAKLAQKVKAGGSGVWGSVPMPPNAQVPDADIKALVNWILTLKK